MAYVYILQGTSGRYYIGSTEDVAKRLERHNSGFVHSTKRIGIPLKLIASSECSCAGEARKVEAMLKRWKNSAQAIEYLHEIG